MQKVTIKAYAVKHKLSIFNVMKMVKSGKLQSEVVEEEGKEVTYIMLDDTIEQEIKNGIIPIDNIDEINLHKEMKILGDEVRLLRDEIEQLKKKL